MESSHAWQADKFQEQMLVNSVAAQQLVSVRLAYGMLTGVMLLWASGVIVARSVHDLAPPIAFSFWRWAAAVALLTPFAAGQVVKNWPYIRTRVKHFMWLGLFMAGGSTLLVWSVRYTTATNASLVSAAQPMMTAVIAWIVLRERLSGVQVLGISAAAAGILVMVARMDLGVILGLSFNPGDLLMLTAVSFYALYSINLHRWVVGLSPLLMTYLTAVGGMLVLLPFYATEALNVASFTPSVPAVAAIFFMVLIPTLLATTMWNVSVGVVGPSRASVFINLLPIFGTLMAVVLLNEQLHLYHLLGGVLVCVGITLVVRPQSA
jgi:drug/metabolite transporter (DMT)-like permease